MQYTLELSQFDLIYRMVTLLMIILINHIKQPLLYYTIQVLTEIRLCDMKGTL